jgi:hypothetical protein
VICFAPSLADSILFLTLTRLVVVFIFVNFSFALFTPSRRLSIGEEAAVRTNLQVRARPRLTTRVANGERIACPGVLPQALISIEGVPLCVDLYIMPLAGFDLVLGTQWIATLGPIVWDIANRTMQFQLQGRMVRWSGTTSTATSAFGVTTGSDQLLDVLLAHFTDIFAEPTGLPPQRGRDHRTILVPGAARVAI